ncbi:MAG: septation ring formation regulator EzrA [Erysipelotrichaceae bacterium]|jgi:septation ring formation regulator|nr:septation ring formation regulator EzrA [Erysipelotrichaceae bacterium]
MDAFLKQLQPIHYAIIALSILLILLIIILLARNSRKKKLRAKMADFEVLYNDAKSVPLTFKLNKAVALARVNEAVVEKVELCKEDFEYVQGDLAQASSILNDLDDAISAGKNKVAKNLLIDIEGTLDRVGESVKKLDAQLDEVLEKEALLREQVNQYKDSFREVKDRFNHQRAALSFSEEALEERITIAEKQFSAFEEWMFASEFGNAEDSLTQIDNCITSLSKIFDELPGLLQRAQMGIPEEIDRVSQLYSRCKQKGVMLDHLEVPKTLEMIGQMLKDDLATLRGGDTGEVESHFKDNSERLTLLTQQLEKEEKAFNELDRNYSGAANKLTQIETSYKESMSVYEKVKDRFDFSVEQKMLSQQSDQIIKYKEQLARLQMQRNDHPASEIVMELRELSQSLQLSLDEITEINQKLSGVRSDEERAHKQLLKLHLILNEIKVQIKRHRLPNISRQCEGDIATAYKHVHTLEDLLKEKDLNLSLLNATLNEAIDYIYTLYKNVNNLIKMATMIEDAIVFGNRYRSTFGDIDSDLTRAELSFRNGEYTQALKTSVAAIEKVHSEPYENLIKENQSSAK